MPDVPTSNASRKKPPRRYSPAVAISHGSPVDRMLAAFGVLIALSSLAFAGYMVADVDRAPRIAGLEYLSIFARPGHSVVIARDRPAAPVVAEASNTVAQSIDTMPTGSIPSIDTTPTGSIPDRAAGRPVNLILTPMRAIVSTPPSSPYKLLDVLNGEALIQTDIGLRHVKAGDLLPDLGRVNTIEKRGDHWVLLTQSGAALEWPPQPPAGDTAAPNKKTSPH